MALFYLKITKKLPLQPSSTNDSQSILFTVFIIQVTSKYAKFASTRQLVAYIQLFLEVNTPKITKIAPNDPFFGKNHFFMCPSMCSSYLRREAHIGPVKQCCQVQSLFAFGLYRDQNRDHFYGKKRDQKSKIRDQFTR